MKKGTRRLADIKHTVQLRNFDDLKSIWNELWCHKRQNIFSFHALLEAWWLEFGDNSDLHLLEVKENSTTIGIAPLIRRKEKAYFIGGSDVFDFLDFIVVPGKENDFFSALIDNLKKEDMECMDLRLVRHDSFVLRNLMIMARNRGLDIAYNEEDILLETDLPNNWNGYLSGLASRHRHELRRKLRRFEEVGNTNFQMIDDSKEISQSMDLFYEQFKESRDDKAAFMTIKMERFFRSLVKVMSEAQLLKLGILKLNESIGAMVICLDDGETVYLYNNSFDPKYRNLNLGFLSKALAIKHSIKMGRRMFNFLKGTERYKYHLGGKETQLYSCQIMF